MALIVNGDVVTDDLIERQRALLLQTLPAGLSLEDSPELAARLHQAAEENAVCRTILHRQALLSGIPISPTEIDSELARRRGNAQSTFCGPGERAQIEEELRLARFIDAVTRGTPRPSRQELEALYTRTISRFRMPERLHVCHIVKNIDELCPEDEALKTMLKARAELQSGKRFAWVADRFSDCAGAGGDLGWVQRGEMVDAFEGVIFAMKTGQVSDIFRTVFGLHIATVVERAPARTLPFTEVRSTLAREAYEERRQTVLTDYLRRLAAQAEIHVMPTRVL